MRLVKTEHHLEKIVQPKTLACFPCTILLRFFFLVLDFLEPGIEGCELRVDPVVALIQPKDGRKVLKVGRPRDLSKFSDNELHTVVVVFCQIMKKSDLLGHNGEV